MEMDTVKMREYADFLEENSRQITLLCEAIEENLSLAIQCMDSKSGLEAARRMTVNLENIKKNIPINDDACQRLILSLKRINDATNVFGGR